MRRAILCIFIISVALAGIACADTGVPETAETQGFITTTIIENTGTATENDVLVWQEYNNGIRGLDGLPPLYFTHDVVYTSSYSEDTIADQGTISYLKNTRLDTQAKPANQYNLETERIIAFEGSTSGLLTTDEDLLLDGAGSGFLTSSILICPFAQSGLSYIPPFCNIVETGSSVDITTGTLATAMEERHVMPANDEGLIPDDMVTDDSDGLYSSEAWPAPISDAGVEVNHNIRLTGVDGEGYAEGSASAFLNARIQESRVAVLIGHTYGPSLIIGPSSDLVYTDGSTAAGRIYLFQKDMRYSSEITQPGIIVPIIPPTQS